MRRLHEKIGFECCLAFIPDSCTRMRNFRKEIPSKKALNWAHGCATKIFHDFSEDVGRAGIVSSIVKGSSVYLEYYENWLDIKTTRNYVLRKASISIHGGHVLENTLVNSRLDFSSLKFTKSSYYLYVVCNGTQEREKRRGQ